MMGSSSTKENRVVPLKYINYIEITEYVISNHGRISSKSECGEKAEDNLEI